jgi:hypothetical protein
MKLVCSVFQILASNEEVIVNNGLGSSGRKRSWPTQKYSSGNWLEGLRKNALFFKLCKKRRV